ncbi:MAG: hypothetical protein ACREGA_01490 [Candidatus Saccharimonadales bacterium]
MGLFAPSDPQQRSEDDLKNILQEIRRTNQLLEALVKANGASEQAEPQY